MDVGAALKAASERAIAHEQMCPRMMRVRLMTHWGDYRGGLTIAVSIAVRAPAEAEIFNAGKNMVTRVVPWDDLDARAGELVALIDECVREVEQNFGIAAA